MLTKLSHNHNFSDMEFFKKLLRHASSDEILVVGSESGLVVHEKNIQVIQFGYFGMMMLLLAAIIFTFSSTADLFLSWKVSYRQDQEVALAITQEEKNLEALQGLSNKKKEIEQQLELIEKAVPIDPRYDRVIASLEQLASSSGIAVPQSISWSIVPPSEISNKDLQAMEVTSYSMEVVGEYDQLLVFLKALRTQQRLMDVRSIGDLQKDPRGVVRAVIVLWAYHNS